MAEAHNKNGVNHESSRDLYLELLKKCLMNTIHEDAPAPSYINGASSTQYSREQRLIGRDWPSKAHTMIGLKRLNNIQTLAEDVLRSGIEGDFLEAGVWRGGATIFMRGVLKAYGVENRSVWVADSFRGFPSRETTSPQSYSSPELKEIHGRVEAGDPSVLASLNIIRKGTQLEEVKENFDRYGLLDNQVRFLEGFFSDTLPSAPIGKLALLRADGDLYDSTYQILENLYPRLSSGGYVIIDDYHTFLECRQAVHDYLDQNKIKINTVQIDQDAIFWQKN